MIFLSYLLLPVCCSNGFSVSEGFRVYTPSSMLKVESDSGFYPLQKNTVTDLDLKVAEKINETSAKDCLKICRKRPWCLRVVHCKTRAKCNPENFCVASETRTCYLAARSGHMLQPAGVCTFTKEEVHHEIGLKSGDMRSSILQIPAELNTLQMGVQKGSGNWKKKTKDTQSAEGIPTVNGNKTIGDKNHEGGFQIKKKMPLKHQDSTQLMKMLRGVNVDIPTELSQNKKTKDTQSAEGIPTVNGIKSFGDKNHEGGFQFKKKMPLKHQDSTQLMDMLRGVNVDIPTVELSQNQTSLPDEKIDENLDGSMNLETSRKNKSFDYPEENTLNELGQHFGERDLMDLSMIADFMTLAEQDAGTSSKQTKNFTKNVEITYENPILKVPKINHVSKEVTIPKTCKIEPTYINQGAVRVSKFSRPGYPVVIEYGCDQTREEKYKYHSGSREAVCDDQGNWTLPAMICIPTSCYIKVAETRTALYGGDVHQDKEGRQCQAWAEDKPHSHPGRHKRKGACPGCGSVEDTGNKCRDMGHEVKPWCYTVDPRMRWEFCDVPACKTVLRCASPPILYGAPAVRTELIGQKVHVTYMCHKDLKYISGRNVSICDMETGLWEWPELKCASENCYYYNLDQWKKVVYLGNVSTTVSGRTCQRWDSQQPQRHYQTANRFPVAKSLSELGNKCRDPDVEGAPWCYTTDYSSRWEFCPVPECTLN